MNPKRWLVAAVCLGCTDPTPRAEFEPEPEPPPVAVIVDMIELANSTPALVARTLGEPLSCVEEPRPDLGSDPGQSCTYSNGAEIVYFDGLSDWVTIPGEGFNWESDSDLMLALGLRPVPVAERHPAFKRWRDIVGIAEITFWANVPEVNGRKATGVREVIVEVRTLRH